MAHNIEVEYRALLSTDTYTNILNLAKSKFSGSLRGPQKIEDAYFCRDDVKCFNEIEMNNVGSYSLRLRRDTVDNKTSATLNVKVITNKGDHNSWLEHEATVSSFEECEKIIKILGFKIFFAYKKNRFTFTDGEIQVCLEDIENFQPAIEVEIITSKEESENAKTKLLDYLESNGISNSSIVNKSITNMLMRERASF